MAAFDEVQYQREDPGPEPAVDGWLQDWTEGLDALAYELGRMDERAQIVRQMLLSGEVQAVRLILDWDPLRRVSLWKWHGGWAETQRRGWAWLAQFEAGKVRTP